MLLLPTIHKGMYATLVKSAHDKAVHGFTALITTSLSLKCCSRNPSFRDPNKWKSDAGSRLFDGCRCSLHPNFFTLSVIDEMASLKIFNKEVHNKIQKSAGKVMCTGTKSVILLDFLEVEATLNSDRQGCSTRLQECQSTRTQANTRSEYMSILR